MESKQIELIKVQLGGSTMRKLTNMSRRRVSLDIIKVVILFIFSQTSYHFLCCMMSLSILFALFRLQNRVWRKIWSSI